MNDNKVDVVKKVLDNSPVWAELLLHDVRDCGPNFADENVHCIGEPLDKSDAVNDTQLHSSYFYKGRYIRSTSNTVSTDKLREYANAILKYCDKKGL